MRFFVISILILSLVSCADRNLSFEYREDGSLLSSKEILNNKMSRVTSYNPSGSVIQVAHYKKTKPNEKRLGTHYNPTNKLIRRISYYENGRVREVAHFRKGKRHGMWKLFNEEGEMTYKAYFYKDIKEGIWTLNFPDFTKSYTIVYSEGKLIGLTEELITAK